MPELHRRTLIVSRARNELASSLALVWERHGLTPVEIIAILAQLQAEHVRYALREERHPMDPTKKADEA